MRILILTYPLIPVAGNAWGGTEQVVWNLLRGLRGRGLQLDWFGAEGSDPAAGGRFTSWPDLLAAFGLLRPQPPTFTPAGLADLERRCNLAVLAWLRRHRVDLIHNQGASFYQSAAATSCPVLLTLHLARELYPPGFPPAAPNLHLQCVSRSQLRDYGRLACCGCIPNGIALELLRPRHRAPPPSAPLMFLGRICPEKGPDLAIRIAHRAGRRLWLVGAVSPFPSHQHYFRTAIQPHLGAAVRWLPPPPAALKHDLLRRAAAVVIPSRVEETSSLVAMEAAAGGVPALALRRGALGEIVANGVTGWLGADWEALAAAVPRLAEISPQACRRRARRAFSSGRMVDGYVALYRRLAASAA